MKNLDIFVVCQKHSSVFFCIEYLLEAQTIFETSHYSLKMKTCCKTTQSLLLCNPATNYPSNQTNKHVLSEII